MRASFTSVLGARDGAAPVKTDTLFTLGALVQATPNFDLCRTSPCEARIGRQDRTTGMHAPRQEPREDLRLQGLCGSCGFSCSLTCRCCPWSSIQLRKQGFRGFLVTPINCTSFRNLRTCSILRSLFLHSCTPAEVDKAAIATANGAGTWCSVLSLYSFKVQLQPFRAAF